MSVHRADIVIVGAGFAGAATAAALVARGVRSVVVLEAEAGFGYHASGLNAAMARRVIEDPLLCRLATESVALIDELAMRRSEHLRDTRGGLLIGNTDHIRELTQAVAGLPSLKSELEVLDAHQLAEQYPTLRQASAEAGLLSPSCGVVDIHALLSAYLDEARRGGALIKLNSPLTRIERQGGRVTGVIAGTTHIACDVLVNAAGFHANTIAALAEVAQVPAVPTRRHLFITAHWPQRDPHAPFIWDVSHGLYFRPEGTGLLLCACDQTPWRSEAPPTDPLAREHLAETFSQHLPALAGVRPSRAWAGLRVLTPDGRFIIGPDPTLAGFYWVAGLGGHGMTTSAGVGAIAADGIVSHKSPSSPGSYVTEFSPGRWSESSTQRADKWHAKHHAGSKGHPIA